MLFTHVSDLGINFFQFENPILKWDWKRFLAWNNEKVVSKNERKLYKNEVKSLITGKRRIWSRWLRRKILHQDGKYEELEQNYQDTILIDQGKLHWFSFPWISSHSFFLSETLLEIETGEKLNRERLSLFLFLSRPILTPSSWRQIDPHLKRIALCESGWTEKWYEED